jgi:hypothetical protein
MNLVHILAPCSIKIQEALLTQGTKVMAYFRVSVLPYTQVNGLWVRVGARKYLRLELTATPAVHVFPHMARRAPLVTPRR